MWHHPGYCWTHTPMNKVVDTATLHVDRTRITARRSRPAYLQAWEMYSHSHPARHFSDRAFLAMPSPIQQTIQLFGASDGGLCVQPNMLTCKLGKADTVSSSWALRGRRAESIEPNHSGGEGGIHLENSTTATTPEK